MWKVLTGPHKHEIHFFLIRILIFLLKVKMFIVKHFRYNFKKQDLCHFGCPRKGDLGGAITSECGLQGRGREGLTFSHNPHGSLFPVVMMVQISAGHLTGCF